jgi:hypothetical protein
MILGKGDKGSSEQKKAPRKTLKEKRREKKQGSNQ